MRKKGRDVKRTIKKYCKIDAAVKFTNTKFKHPSDDITL